METRRWVNQSQPQTLVIAVFLLYICAVFTLLFFSEGIYYAFAVCFLSATLCGGVQLLRFAIAAAAVAAGYGIANEQRWGYTLGIVVAALPLAARLVAAFVTQTSPFLDPISLLFDVALFALLVHPQSREYQKIWFAGTKRRR